MTTYPQQESETGQSGWLTFAGIMLLIVGSLNVVYGVAAIDNASFYVGDARFVVSDLSTWGWILLLVGILQFTAGTSLFMGASFGRWVGIITATVNAVAQLLFLPSYPWLSLALLALDILVIYGLVVHGGRRRLAT